MSRKHSGLEMLVLCFTSYYFSTVLLVTSCFDYDFSTVLPATDCDFSSVLSAFTVISSTVLFKNT